MNQVHSCPVMCKTIKRTVIISAFVKRISIKVKKQNKQSMVITVGDLATILIIPDYVYGAFSFILKLQRLDFHKMKLTR